MAFKMAVWWILVYLCIVVTVTSQKPATDDDVDKLSQTVLSLLNVLPFPDDRSFAGFDRAHELIPAANLAVEHINRRTDLLPRYTLEVVNVDSEACGISVINKGLVNTYRGLVDGSHLVVGVVGMFCAGVTNVVSPLATLPLFDRLQIAGSTSSLHRNVVKFPRLYHAVSSSALFGEAVIKLMFEFGWRKIAIVHDSNGVGFQSSAEDFADLVTKTPEFELVTTVPIIPSSIPQVSSVLILERARIVFLPVTTPEAANIMCKAFKSNALWPSFVYIFKEQSVGILLNEETLCTRDEMTVAIEGIFLLYLRTEVDSNVVLVSGLTYEDYWNEYLRRLHQIELQNDMILDTQNTIANIAHDQIWALSLALNNSIEPLRSINKTLEDYRSTPTLISDIVQEQLSNIRFQGAAGYFELNDDHETSSSITIFQIQNGTPTLLGLYDPQQSDNIFFLANISNIPDDTFEDVFTFLPLSVVIPLSLVIFFGVVFTTFILILLLCYRKRPEIKASSPYLSIISFIGCYMVFASSFLQIVAGVVENGISFICNLDTWLVVIAISLIFGTIFMRLLRVYYIFKKFGKTGRFWSDGYLVLAILGLAMFHVTLLVIASVVDPLYTARIETYISQANPPYFEVQLVCNGDHVQAFLLTSSSYNGVILLLSVVLAFRTRHIKRTNFKDTKKIAAFLYVSVFIFVFGVLIAIVLRFRTQSRFASVITAVLSGCLIAVLCQAFIFAPKVIPLLFSSKSTNFDRTQSQFSLIESHVSRIRALIKHVTY